MRISVVIPAYNEERYIGACLESLMKQTKKPFEIIVVNNNSTDKTVEIAKSFEGVRVIEVKVQGIAPTRNAGFNAARSEIIARTDADTVVSEDWIETIILNFKEKHTIAITGPALLGEYAGSEMVTKIQEFIFFNISRLILHHNAIYGLNLALRRKYWHKVQYEVCTHDSTIHEDLDLAIHLNKFGDIKFVPDLLVKTSGRRITSNFTSILFEYNIKYWRTIFSKHGSHQ
jgi:glycosyltransferase involved in cell wall biosynthesis